MTEPVCRVVIVGGGFAGLNAAKVLGNVQGVEVTLLDSRNYHLFQPLLYQVAMAGLNPSDIASPIRSMLARYRNVRVLLDEVVTIDLPRRQVVTRDDPLPYDYLILACGTQHAYFGRDEWEPHAPGLKTLEQATEIRRRVLTAFEEAEKCTDDPERRRQLLTFVVVGGGPTGVELAGAIAEMSRFTLAHDFRSIDPRMSQVILVEGGARILGAFAEPLADNASRSLARLGVQVWTSCLVTSVDANGIEACEKSVPAATVIWAAGVEASPLGRGLGVPLDPQGRVHVERTLNIRGYPEVFVVGDQAHCLDEEGNPYPGLAPVALQQGRSAARNILRDLAGRPRREFSYLDKGMMAAIGRSKAVGQFRKMRFTGFIAWLAWLLVHIYYLTGFANRLMVVLQWGWSYLTFKRGARLITQPDWRLYKRGRSGDGR
ncbi:NAD(P)/FAD-dependent oxidoreductase [Geomobilimonas luticola]|uniref:NADH:ubiquinone reductase (non-electrogenic) n=1 Tax=Geomobilimonas luticola TaxID=1114878 RepID=A0ABS5S8B5_9BACT|nr:NAD(P)/FAD-dependent oxidoreductase [Geomobilimonas luticola]MBT0651615.1 NAD(P)/FAD-dependent oxidoreductase [Geomobilimonas luticola]